MTDASATLMERPRPYHLAIDLARGKINQLRGQAADWEASGLEPVGRLETANPRRDRRLQPGLDRVPDEEASVLAATAFAKRLSSHPRFQANLYIDQVFTLRHQRQAKLDTALDLPPGIRRANARRDRRVPAQPSTRSRLPFSWRHIEPSDRKLDWEATDQDRQLGPVARPAHCQPGRSSISPDAIFPIGSGKRTRTSRS